MYNVSQAYLNQIKKPYAFRRALRGTIGDVQFTNEEILSGSFSLSNQCSEPNEVKIGSVNVGELQVTFKKGLLERDSWKGQVITISEGLWIEINQEYEYVPLGIFTVDEATYDKDGVKITAYDNMLKFDKHFGVSTTIGSAYSILRMLCIDCGVTLGMTESQIRSLPNGTMSLALYTENDCETYRDVLFWLAQTLACFATIDRSGRLVLRQYGNTSIDSISAGLRFDDNEFSDFETEYSGIAYTDIDTDEYIYYSLEIDNKLTYNLGANPFIQYGTKSTKDQMCRNILNVIKNIKYVPFSTSLLHTPAYDLGDVIIFTDGIADRTKKSCIMFYEYKFSSYSAEGFGSNPALANARGKSDKDISGIKSKTDKNGIQYYTYMNADDIDIADGVRKSIAALRFTTINTKKVTFQAEILVDVNTSSEAEITVIYQMDGAELRYKPVETWRDGKHILSLWHVIEVEPNTLFRWQVFLEGSGGTVHINAEESRAAIWGQGLVAVDVWDGYIDLEDTFSGIGLESISVSTFTDTFDVDTVTPHSPEAEDEFSAISLEDNIDVAEFFEVVYINRTSLFLEGYTWADLLEMDWGEVFDNHLW